MEVFVIVIGLLVAFIIGIIVSPRRINSTPKALRHQHIWQISSSKPFREFAPGAKMGRDKSRVLKTCFCGEYKVDIIEGNWNMAELTTTKV